MRNLIELVTYEPKKKTNSICKLLRKVFSIKSK